MIGVLPVLGETEQPTDLVHNQDLDSSMGLVAGAGSLDNSNCNREMDHMELDELAGLDSKAETEKECAAHADFTVADVTVSCEEIENMLESESRYVEPSLSGTDLCSMPISLEGCSVNAKDGDIINLDGAEKLGSMSCTQRVCGITPTGSMQPSDLGRNNYQGVDNKENPWLAKKIFPTVKLQKEDIIADDGISVRLHIDAIAQNRSKLEKALVGKLLGKRIPYTFLY